MKTNNDTSALSYKQVHSSGRLGKEVMFLQIDAQHDGQRIDNFLITLWKGAPKSLIYKIIRKGEVRLNKGRIKQTAKLREGDVLRLPPIKLTLREAANVDGDRYQFLLDNILFEDEALMVLNKPSGMAVHAGSGIKVGVIEALRAVRADLSFIELTHRLDRETSGCLVLAKKPSVLKKLNGDFASSNKTNKLVEKSYLALVKGNWKYGQRLVEKPLDTESRRRGERHVIVSSNGSYAKSIFSVVCKNERASLMNVDLVTGRTHQVRVHALSEGHPLAGDARYGDSAFNKQLKQTAGLNRLFLHAASIRIFHPISAESIRFEAPLPSDLVSVLKAIGIGRR